jgi:hypothetical protein
VASLDQVLAQQAFGDDGKGLAAFLNAKLTQGAVHVLRNVDQYRFLARVAAAPVGAAASTERRDLLAGERFICVSGSGTGATSSGTGTASGSSSKMPANAEGFFAIMPPRLLA